MNSPIAKIFTTLLITIFYSVFAAQADSPTPASTPTQETNQTEPQKESQTTDNKEIKSDSAAVPAPLTVKPAHAIVIDCNEMIDDGLFESIKRRSEQAMQNNANYIIFKMDTFGGRLDSAIAIWTYIMDLNKGKKVHTVAYVTTKAISAGALISVACQDIIMAKATVIGDCAPIAMGDKLEGIEREKAESPTRTYFETAAKENGYPAAICKAMVTMNIEVYQVKNVKSGQYEYFEGDNLPADADQYDLAGKKLIDTKEQLVTLHADQAKEYGIARAVVDDLDGALQYLESRDHVLFNRPVATLETTWSENLVRWLASPTVTGILVMLAMLGIYAEFNHPGLILPGAVAVIALALLFGSKYFIGLANWWEIAVFIIGLILLLVELFLIPGFGVAGITGIVLMVFALGAIMVGNPPDKLPIPDTTQDWSLLKLNLEACLLGFLGFLIGAYFIGRYFYKIPFANRLILTSLPQPPAHPVVQIESPDISIHVGDVGIAMNQLRPAGWAKIADHKVDVVSRGDLIEAGKKITVVEIEGNRIVVKEIESGK